MVKPKVLENTRYGESRGVFDHQNDGYVPLMKVGFSRPNFMKGGLFFMNVGLIFIKEGLSEQF